MYELVNNWIFPVIPQNWDTIQSRGIFATRQHVTERVHEGDKVLFFVSGTRSLRGIFETTGTWYKSDGPHYPNELKEQRIIYRWEIKIKPIALGVADLRKIIGALSFIKNKSDWGIYFQSTPGNHGHSLPEEDYNLILQEMQRNPGVDFELKKPAPGWTEVSSVSETSGTVETVVDVYPNNKKHDFILSRLMTLGEVYGFETFRKPSVNDILPQNKPFTSKSKEHDVGWKLGYGAWIPIEIQVHGTVEDLMYRFNIVHQFCHRMIVVADGQDKEEVEEVKKRYPFGDKIIVLNSDEVLKATHNLEGLVWLRRKIFE